MLHTVRPIRRLHGVTFPALTPPVSTPEVRSGRLVAQRGPRYRSGRRSHRLLGWKKGAQRDVMGKLGVIQWVFPKIVVPPKSSILIGFSSINHPFFGVPPFKETTKWDLMQNGGSSFWCLNVSGHFEGIFPEIIVPEVWVGNRMTLANGWLGCIPHLKFSS